MAGTSHSWPSAAKSATSIRLGKVGVKQNVRALVDSLVTSKWDRGLLAASSSRLRAAFSRGPSTAVNGSPQVLSKTTLTFTEKPSGSLSVPF